MGESWDDIKEAVARALECGEQERAALLAGYPLEIRAEVESLLAVESRVGEFLERPALGPRAAEDLAARAELEAGAPDDPGGLVGETVDGKYRIEALAGRGGMGAVYRGTHLGTERPVAVKVVAPEFLANPEFVERFRREARAAGRLRHPNVVNVTDFGFCRARGREVAYLVMEHLEGLTLGELLRREGPLGLELVSDILEQTSLAVAEAHSRGILHRDLKPENLWLEPNGRGGYTVKVLDFGLARLRDVPQSPASSGPHRAGFDSRSTRAEAGEASGVPVGWRGAASPPEATASRMPAAPPAAPPAEPPEAGRTDPDRPADRTAGTLDPRTAALWRTRAGMVLGTPAYMSPEQCRGERLDVGSDVYSLGVIVYEMLAGSPPFAHDDPRLLEKQCEMPAPPLRARREVGPGVEEAVLRALAKAPGERPSTARAFAVTFSAAAKGERGLREDARRLLHAHRWAVRWATISACTPMLLFGSAVAVALFDPSSIGVPESALVQVGLFLAAAVAPLVGIDACAVGAVEAIGAAERLPGRDPLTTGWIDRPLRALPRVAGAVLLGIWSPSAVLAGVVAGSEGLSPAEAVRRSRALGGRVRPVGRGLYVSRISGSVALSVFLLVGYAAFERFLAYLPLGLTGGRGAPVCFGLSALAAGLLTATVVPTRAYMGALLYLVAREANGEARVAWASEPARPRERAGGGWPRLRAMTPHAGRVLSVLLCVVVLVASYVLVVPPPGGVALPSPERATGQVWRRYGEAARRAAAEPGRDPRYGLHNSFGAYATGSEPSLAAEALKEAPWREEAVRTFLEIARTREAGGSPSGPAPPPSESQLLEQLTLVSLTLARARELSETGESAAAARHFEAVLTLAADLGEGATSMSDVQIGSTFFSRAARSVSFWLSSGGGDPAHEAELARRFAMAGRRLVEPAELVRREWEERQRSLYSAWIGLRTRDPWARAPNLAGELLPGLRARFYGSVVGRYEGFLESVEPELSRWDLSSVRERERLLARDPWVYEYVAAVEPGLLYSLDQIRTPASLALICLSMSRGYCAAAQALLVADAYHKRHGALPATLDEAFAEAGLSVPLDPATGRPIRWRVEGSSLVVWLAGSDWADDGGGLAYEYDHYGGESGRDVVLTLGPPVR